MASAEEQSTSSSTTARPDTSGSSVGMSATNGVSPPGGFHHFEPQQAHPRHGRLSADQRPATAVDGSAAMGYDDGAAIEQVLSQRTQSRPLQHRPSRWDLDDYFVRCPLSPRPAIYSLPKSVSYWVVVEAELL